MQSLLALAGDQERELGNVALAHLGLCDPGVVGPTIMDALEEPSGSLGRHYALDAIRTRYAHRQDPEPFEAEFVGYAGEQFRARGAAAFTTREKQWLLRIAVTMPSRKLCHDLLSGWVAAEEDAALRGVLAQLATELLGDTAREEIMRLAAEVRIE